MEMKIFKNWDERDIAGKESACDFRPRMHKHPRRVSSQLSGMDLPWIQGAVLDLRKHE